MHQPINPDYPVTEVRSIDELMDIAVAMEHEAARRYEQLARRTEAHGEAEMVALFRQLAQLERDHERGLAAWAGREGRRTPTPTTFAWRLPETFGDEADERPLDPYQALAIAVRNEERAFSFYAYLAALCDADAQLTARAEALAREELNHVAQLRALRRSAFHQRTAAPPRPAIADLDDLYQMAAGLERASAEIDGLLAGILDGAGQHTAALMLSRCRDSDRQRLAGLTAVQGSAKPGAESDCLLGARRAGLLRPGALTAEGALALALRNAQEVLDHYLTAADHATDAGVLAEAQVLAEAAMARLAVIRALAPAQDD